MKKKNINNDFYLEMIAYDDINNIIYLEEGNFSLFDLLNLLNKI